MPESEVKIIEEEISAEDRDLAKAKEDASKVKSMLNSPGWKEIVEPALQRAKDNIPAELKEAQTFEDFLKVQQGLIAIDYLFTFIKVKLAEGVRAEEKEGMISE